VIRGFLRRSCFGSSLIKIRNFLRPFWIPIVQAVILCFIPRKNRRLIIFLTPGYAWKSGGIMAIGMHYRESIQLKNVHSAAVVLCTNPKDPLLLKYTWFKNRNYILRFGAVLRHFTRLEWLLIHIPEYAVNQFIEGLGSKDKVLLRQIGSVQLNVMMQNVDLIQGQNVAGLAEFGQVTCTTAHEAYATPAMRSSLGVPLHRLSVHANFDQYIRRPYEQKQALLVVSPDKHPLKERVLQRIAESHPTLTIQVIQGLAYDEYTRLISRAKWSLTFGEGLDGYFAEPILSGGVAFAVFNDRFFTPEYAVLETVYPSWDSLEQRIASDLKRLDEPHTYRRCSSQARDLLLKKYNNDEYRENLRRFYRAEYTFP
jgi:hypothetical protein